MRRDCSISDHTRMLQLNRPLVVFDLEATSVDPETARIIQVALFRLEPDDGAGTITEQLTTHVDPGVPIPAEVTDLTGIAEVDVAGAPAFPDLVSDLNGLVADADLAGFNVLSYDLPLLKAEYERAAADLAGPADRQVLDVYKLEQVLVPRTLEALFETYTGAPLQEAHNATADVEATIAVLNAQLRTHQPEARTPAALADLIRGEYLDDNRRLKRVQTDDGQTGVQVCFGKHNGRTVREIQRMDPGYLDWMRDAIDDLRPHLDAALRDDESSDGGSEALSPDADASWNGTPGEQGRLGL